MLSGGSKCDERQNQVIYANTIMVKSLCHRDKVDIVERGQSEDWIFNCDISCSPKDIHILSLAVLKRSSLVHGTICVAICSPSSPIPNQFYFKNINSNNLVEKFWVFKEYPSTININLIKTNFLGITKICCHSI